MPLAMLTGCSLHDSSTCLSLFFFLFTAVSSSSILSFPQFFFFLSIFYFFSLFPPHRMYASFAHPPVNVAHLHATRRRKRGRRKEKEELGGGKEPKTAEQALGPWRNQFIYKWLSVDVIDFRFMRLSRKTLLYRPRCIHYHRGAVTVCFAPVPVPSYLSPSPFTVSLILSSSPPLSHSVSSSTLSTHFYLFSSYSLLYFCFTFTPAHCATPQAHEATHIHTHTCTYADTLNA